MATNSVPSDRIAHLVQISELIRNYGLIVAAGLGVVLAWWRSRASNRQAIAALQQYGGTVIKTSLSDEDTKKLQKALQPPASVGTDA